MRMDHETRNWELVATITGSSTCSISQITASDSYIFAFRVPDFIPIDRCSVLQDSIRGSVSEREQQASWLRRNLQRLWHEMRSGR